MAQTAPTPVAAQPQQMSLIRTMAGKYGLEPTKFKQTIVKTLFPSDKQNPSDEQVAAFLIVANKYDLDPFRKEIYAFPAKGGGIVPIVSIDGWLTVINRQPCYDGVEFVDNKDADGNLQSITAKIFRTDRSHPVMVTEYLKECKKNTEPWNQFPSRMLRHKALMQAARYAFGISGIVDQDEAERIAAMQGDDTPTPIAVITEEQRTVLVNVAKEVGVIERLGVIVNSFGFEMLAHITVDRYADVLAAIEDSGKPSDTVDGEIVEEPGDHVDSSIHTPPNDVDAEPYAGPFDGEPQTEATPLERLRANVIAKLDEMTERDRKNFLQGKPIPGKANEDELRALLAATK